jgi:uncharacterized protein
MCAMDMLPNIVAHSLQVCRIAAYLAESLEKRGIMINHELVRASALLHDITKTRSLTTGETHAHTGAELVDKMGYPEVAYIISHHVILDENFVSDQPTEVEVVNYSDKRVLHDRIVSLRERMDYIIVRYAKNPGDRERIMASWLRVSDLEKKLFHFLPFSPEDLNIRLESNHVATAIDEYHAFCAGVLKDSMPAPIAFDEFPPKRVRSI